MNPLLRWLTSPEWTHVVGALLHSLWQGAIIAIALAGLMRRMVNPVTRYRCALGALGLLVIASIVTWALLNAPKPAVSVAAPIPITESTVALVAPAALNPNSTDKVVAFGRMSLPPAPKYWTAWLALVWMVGATVMLLRAGIKVAGAENLRRSCQPLDDERMVALVAEARQAVGLVRKIRVAVTDKLTSPAVVGVIVPTLILPLSLFTALTPEQIRFILLHELAHIRRGDYFANLFQLFAEALLFFNPAVWWISQQIRREREVCCDALAIELSGAPADYARTLVRVAENILHPATTAALAFGDGQREPSSLADRVQRLLVPGYRPALRLTWRAMLASLIVGGMLLVLSAVGTRNTVGAILSPRENTTALPEATSAVELSTRTFAVGPIELARASGRVWPGYVTNAAEMVQAFMVKAGVDLQPPKTVFFKDTLGLLMVRATRGELDTIEKFLVQANQDAASATLPSGKTAEARAIIPVPKNTPATSVSDGSTNLQLRIYAVDGNAMVQVLERQRGTKAGSGVKPITDGSQLLPEIQKLFASVGVELQPPKSVFFNEPKGQLLVRATLADLDTIEHVVQVLNDQPPQVNIKVRWVEISQSLVRSGLLPFLTNALPLPISRTQSLSGFLTEKQMAEVRKRIDSEDGMTLLSEGDVTTLTDRQAQIQTTEIKTIVTGINPKALTRPGVTATNNSGLEFMETQLMPLGQTLDVIPTVSRDQANISLRVIVTLSEFLGYSKTTSTVPVYVNGEEKMGFSPLPRYRVQQMIKDCVVPDEQTFFLGNPAITEVAKQPNGEFLTTDVTGSKTNVLFVFVTPTLIDPAGNRVNLQGKSPPNSPPVSK